MTFTVRLDEKAPHITVYLGIAEDETAKRWAIYAHQKQGALTFVCHQESFLGSQAIGYQDLIDKERKPDFTLSIADGIIYFRDPETGLDEIIASRPPGKHQFIGECKVVGADVANDPHSIIARYNL